MNTISLKKIVVLMIFVSGFVNSCPTRYGLNCLKDPNSHQNARKKITTKMMNIVMNATNAANIIYLKN